MTHTTGPWTVRPEPNGDRGLRRFIGANVGEHGEDINHEAPKNGGIWIAETKGPDAEANARLIVKSPEMRASLATLVKYARWQMAEGANYHPTLRSAVAEAQALLDATS